MLKLHPWKTNMTREKKTTRIEDVSHIGFNWHPDLKVLVKNKKQLWNNHLEKITIIHFHLPFLMKPLDGYPLNLIMACTSRVGCADSVGTSTTSGPELKALGQENMAKKNMENKKTTSRWFNSCPFHPLVGGHLTFSKGHLTIPKRSLWITWLVSSVFFGV